MTQPTTPALDITTSDGRLRLHGDDLHLIHTDGQVFKFAGAASSAAIAFASDLATARAQLADKDRLLGMARAGLTNAATSLSASGKHFLAGDLREILAHFPPTTTEPAKP